MDPLSCLPPEVMESIWGHLELPDLLSCRLVAASWNSCLISDPVWKRYLPLEEPRSAWERFLQLKRTDYRWNNGACKTYTLEISQDQFAIGDHNIYIGRENSVKCLSPALEEVYTYEFGSKIVGIHPFSNMVAFVLLEGKCDYKIRIFKGQEAVRDFQSNVNRISAGAKTVCFQVEDTVVVFDGRAEAVHNLPGDVYEVIATNDRLMVKTASSVFMGSNFSFYLLGPEGWEVVWKGRNSPMGCMFGHLEATSHCLALVGGTQTDSGYAYSGLHISGKGVVDNIESSRTPYFRSYSSGDTLVYTQNDRSVKRLSTRSWSWEQTNVEPGVQLVRTRGNSLVLVYHGWWQLLSSSSRYSREGPAAVEGAVVRRSFLALWSKSSLHIFDFADPGEVDPREGGVA